MADPGPRDQRGQLTSAPEVGGGRPSLPSGEPILARWFVILMLILVPLGLAVSIWAWLSIDREALSPAARRPPGTAEITHDRGTAVLNDDVSTEPGPECAEDVDVFGDEGARAAGRRALSGVCTVLRRGETDAAETGLDAWIDGDGLLRFAVFERTGLDSSARVEDGRIVIELNAKFQFEDASEAAPFIVHELVHLADGWPGEPVTDRDELRALQAQAAACDILVFRNEAPRGCDDAAALLADPDPLSLLDEAGYLPGS